MTALLIVVLVGIAALALDLGRVLTLRTEMQNAADASALAGAAELDGKVGAQGRATAAARNLLKHYGHHDISDTELLGETLQDAQEGRPAIEFFCYIGSEHDVEGVCTGEQIVEDGHVKVRANGDADTHYIRVNLLPNTDDEAYTVQLYFLPVLGFVTGDPKGFQKVSASALAGRHFTMCNFPPIMICDPFEDGAGVTGVSDLKQAVDEGYLSPGDMVVLKYQSNNWEPGGFGYLYAKTEPGTENKSYSGHQDDIARFLANPCHLGCTPPLARVKQGSMQGWPEVGLNTLFEVYGKKGSENFTSSDYPAAPNVIEYPLSPDSQDWDNHDPKRFYTREWPIEAYLDKYHKRPDGSYDEGFSLVEIKADYAGCVGDGSTIIDPDLCPSRWDIYNREIDRGYLPLNPLGINDLDDAGAPDDIADPDSKVCLLPGSSCSPTVSTWSDPWSFEDACGKYAQDSPQWKECWPHDDYAKGYIPDGLPAYSSVNAASINADMCEDPSKPKSVPDRRTLYVAVLSCKALGSISPNDIVPISAFAKFFMLQRAPLPAVSDMDFVGEFIKLGDEQDAEYHVDVQLYE